jgi:hypothetical protein
VADAPLYRRLLKPLSRLLTTEQQDDDALADDDEADSPDFAEQDIHQSLDDVLKQEAGRYGTKVHVVSLAGFREAVGSEKWRKMADKVLMIAESAIHRNIGKGGVFGRRGEDMYVMVFSRLSPREALARGQQVAKEVGERLMGSARFSADGLVHCVEMDLDAALGDDGELNLGALADAVAEVRAAEEADPETAKRREELRRSLQPSDWQPPEGERRTFAEAKPIEAMSDAAVDKVETANGRYEIEVLPTWEAQGEALASGLVQIIRHDRPDLPVLIGNAAYTGGQGVAFALDQLVADQAMRLLQQLASEHLRTVLVVPIHFSSLVTRQRMMVTGIYARVPDAVRKLRLDLEVFGAPPEPTPSQLADVCSALKPLCRDVLLRLPSPHFAPGLAADARFDAIGLDVEDMAEEDRGDAMVLRALASLQQGAESVGLNSYSWHLRSRPTIRGAVRLGVGRVNGPALMKALPKPRAPLPVPKTKFLEG